MILVAYIANSSPDVLCFCILSFSKTFSGTLTDTKPRKSPFTIVLWFYQSKTRFVFVGMYSYENATPMAGCHLLLRYLLANTCNYALRWV
jgi:hypothetical protein